MILMLLSIKIRVTSSFIHVTTPLDFFSRLAFQCKANYLFDVKNKLFLILESFLVFFFLMIYAKEEYHVNLLIIFEA